MIHLYHGDGKGKTTAAVGLAVRGVGRGKRVYIVQFLKGTPSGEIVPLLNMRGITILRGRPETKFVFQMSESEKEEVTLLHQRQVNLAFDAAEQGAADMLILDEVLDAVNTGTLSQTLLLERIKACPEAVEIVLTGREPAQELMQIADYITYMKKEKHPFDSGVPARRGIEY